MLFPAIVAAGILIALDVTATQVYVSSYAHTHRPLYTAAMLLLAGHVAFQRRNRVLNRLLAASIVGLTLFDTCQLDGRCEAVDLEADLHDVFAGSTFALVGLLSLRHHAYAVAGVLAVAGSLFFLVEDGSTAALAFERILIFLAFTWHCVHYEVVHHRHHACRHGRIPAPVPAQ